MKKTTMKIIGTMIVLMALLTAFIPAPLALGVGVPVTIDAPAEAAPGSSFTASIDIGEVTELNAAQYDIWFDPLVLELTAITDGLIGGTAFPIPTVNATPQELAAGHWRVVQSLGTNAVSGSGYLSVLHFDVIGSPSDSSDITLTDGMLSGMDGNEIPATWTGATVTMPDIPTWSVPMTADAGNDGINDLLVLGTDAAATDDFDFGLDWEHLPLPPGSPFDAYFQTGNVTYPALDEDWRPPSSNIVWTLYAYSTTQEITLSWNAAEVSAELSAYMNTGAEVINMKTESSVVLTPGIYTITITISSEVAIQIELKAGWNMVSLPVVPGDNSVSTLFPTVGGRAYRWNPDTKSYSWGTTMEPGKGYFVTTAADNAVTILGVPLTTYTEDIYIGWNMVGSVVEIADFTDPQDNPDGSVGARAYRWNPETKSYSWGTIIEPGKGYFVTAYQACTLTVQNTP